MYTWLVRLINDNLAERNIKDLINFSKVKENYVKKLSEDWNKNKIKLIKYILNS